jgi:hypothetical protein
MSCVDQNAFGVFVGFFDIEDVEYSSSPVEFVARFERFRELALEFARARPIAPKVMLRDFGHALYFEFEDGDQVEDPLGWLRALSRSLTDEQFLVTGVLTHGGRWVDEAELPGDGAAPDVSAAPGLDLLRVSRPSEPLRRVLYADSASHGAEGTDGWGPGVFVDEEAIEALKRTFKNAPTPLLAAGATFFRIGS